MPRDNTTFHRNWLLDTCFKIWLKTGVSNLEKIVCTIRMLDILARRKGVYQYVQQYVFVEPRNYAASIFFVGVKEVHLSLSKSEISISVLADSMKKYLFSEFVSPKLSARDSEIRWTVFIPFFIQTQCQYEIYFLAMFPSMFLIMVPVQLSKYI